MVDTPTAVAVVAGLILTLGCLFLWRALARSRAEAHRLRQQIAHLKREHAARASLRMTFEFNATTREALLHVTNDGTDANVWGQMSVEGALSDHVDGALRPLWQNDTSPVALLPQGQTRALRLAQLDLSVFPYAQWEIYASNAAGVTAFRAMHTSTIGGDPDTHAPPVFLQVALSSSPECMGPLPHSTIALQPFDAVRLRPV